MRSDSRFSSEQEEKLVYAEKATRGHWFCGFSTTPGGRGFPPTCFIPWVRDILMVRDIMRHE